MRFFPLETGYQGPRRGRNTTEQRGQGPIRTHVCDTVDLSQHGGNRLPDERDGLEEAGLPDEYVEQSLVHAHEIAKAVEDGVGVLALGHLGHVLHLGHRRGPG